MALINVEIREPSLIRIDGSEAANRRSGDKTDESDSREESAVEFGGPVDAVVSLVTTLTSLYGLLRSRDSDDGEGGDGYESGGYESGGYESGGYESDDGGYAVEQTDEAFEIDVEEEEATDGGGSKRKLAAGLALVAVLAAAAYVLTGSEEEDDLEPQF